MSFILHALCFYSIPTLAHARYKPSNPVRFIIKCLTNDFPDQAAELDDGEEKPREMFV